MTCELQTRLLLVLTERTPVSTNSQSTREAAGFLFHCLLTSLSNCDSGASPQSMPPPDDSELSDGEVMVWRLDP